MALKQHIAPRTYFNKLNLDEMDEQVANYIRDEILSDSRLETLPEDSEEYKEVVRIVEDNYPKALSPSGKPEPEPKKSKELIEHEQKKEKAKQILMTRLKIIKKLLESDPSNSLLGIRAKVVEKMIDEK